MSYTIVGVIGHIDHGKTSLVAALTGIDTDTHPEEKQRGITIDLGFASFRHGDHTFALVDAPGHQKYIGNLLAGVSSVDIGLLVVAADQGIQEQTLEHAAIIHSLGVEKLIAVVSRTDLVDAAAIETVTEELEVFLVDYGFQHVPTVAVSVVSNDGIDRLKTRLVDYARTKPRQASDLFRMPIDRAFTIEGRGTVVAGTPWSGSVRVGDRLQIARTGQAVRVRGLESHGQPLETSELGFRTAINLVGSADPIARGDELVAVDSHPLSTRMIANVNLFRDADDLKLPALVQLHTATTSCSARLSGPGKISRGDSSIVVIDTERPLIVTFGQQCLLRNPYPVGSFAGAEILGTVQPARRQSARLHQLGQQIIQSDLTERLIAWVEFESELGIDPTDLELRLGIPRDVQQETIDQIVESSSVFAPQSDRLVSTAHVSIIENTIKKWMEYQAQATERPWLAESSLVQRCAKLASPYVTHWVIERMVANKSLVRSKHLVAIASEQTRLSKKQRGRMEQIMAMFHDSKTPPTLKEIATQLGTTMETVESLTRFATQQQSLVDLGHGFLMDRNVFLHVCVQLNERFEQSPWLTVADIRDALGITRKYAIPLLEYCDAIGVTNRDGDTRTSGAALAGFLEEYQDEHG